MKPLSYKQFIITILVIISIIFIYRLFKYYNNEDLLENFDSVLTKLKTKDNFANLFNNKTGTKIKHKLTFDDLIKETETINPTKYSISNMKHNFFTYVNSFKKDKFKNVTGTTTEALEKFDYFKEKFFEIFQ